MIQQILAFHVALEVSIIVSNIKYARWFANASFVNTADVSQERKVDVVVYIGSVVK